MSYTGEQDEKVYVDKELICSAGCGQSFTWTRGEQIFMDDLLANGKIQQIVEPKRCKECRIKARQMREARQ